MQRGWTRGAATGPGLLVAAVIVDRIDLLRVIESLEDQLRFQVVADKGAEGVEFGVGAVQADKRDIERTVRTVQPQAPARGLFAQPPVPGFHRTLDRAVGIQRLASRAS